MSNLELRCILCGKVYGVAEDHPNFKKLSEPEKPAAFVCDLCHRKVQHESEESRKPKRPVG